MIIGDVQFKSSLYSINFLLVHAMVSKSISGMKSLWSGALYLCY